MSTSVLGVGPSSGTLAWRLRGFCVLYCGLQGCGRGSGGCQMGVCRAGPSMVQFCTARVCCQ